MTAGKSFIPVKHGNPLSAARAEEPWPPTSEGTCRPYDRHGVAHVPPWGFTDLNPINQKCAVTFDPNADIPGVIPAACPEPTGITSFIKPSGAMKLANVQGQHTVGSAFSCLPTIPTPFTAHRELRFFCLNLVESCLFFYIKNALKPLPHNVFEDVKKM
jgi:hypothetical protein